MKAFRCLLLAVLLGASAGCITFLTQIHLRPDGSGTMVQTMTMNPEQMKETMEAMAKQMGASSSDVKESDKAQDEKAGKKADKKAEDSGPFKESDLQAKAKDLGEGVTFLSADKIDSKTAAGVRVTYAFKNINTLSVNPKPGAALGTEGAGTSAPSALKFRFEQKGDRAVLTVAFPKEKPSEKSPEAAPPAPSPEQQAQQLDMLRQMFKGMHIGLSIEIDGKLLRTTSPFVSGNNVTLFDLDFDPLLSNAKSLESLNTKLAGAMGDDARTMAALQGVPGLKVNVSPEIRIEMAAH